MFTCKEGTEHLTQQAVLNLYKSVNWTAYLKDPDLLMTAIANSTFVQSVWDTDRLIGLTRSLSDDCHIHYLQDILVVPEYQRHGVGRELLNRCLKHFEHVRTHVLLTDDEERQKMFYEACGFRCTHDLKKHALRCFVKIKDVELL